MEIQKTQKPDFEEIHISSFLIRKGVFIAVKTGVRKKVGYKIKSMRMIIDFEKSFFASELKNSSDEIKKEQGEFTEKDIKEWEAIADFVGVEPKKQMGILLDSEKDEIIIKVQYLKGNIKQFRLSK